MPASNVLITHLITQSTYLFERLAPGLSASASPAAPAERLAEWTAAISDPASPQALEKYLGWNGLDAAAVSRMLSSAAGQAEAPLPPWAAVLEQVLTGGPWPALAADDLPAEPLPFQEVFAPFLSIFQERLAGSAGLARLGLQARKQLNHSLLRQLALHARECLYLDFQAYRARQPFGALNMLLPRAGGTLPTGLYRQFIAQLSATLPAFLQRYPVLARLLAETTTYSARALVEMLDRLEADYATLEGQAAPAGLDLQAQPLGQVVELRTSLSDSHHGGRTVAILKFENGWQVVYKPRPLHIESVYNRLLDWMNQHGAPLDQKTLAVLERDGYGWVEFAPYLGCSDVTAMQRFYRRLGMLLAVFYILEGTDCHLENLIACGEYPLLVDSETLFHPHAASQSAEGGPQDAYERGYDRLARSVLRVGLLPGWRMGKDRRTLYDSSGLGAFGEQLSPYRRPRFIHVNTDAMQMNYVQAQVADQSNIPRLNGQPARLEDYTAELQAGFAEFYRFLLEQRGALLAEDSPLQAFRGCIARFVFRATQVYASLLREAGQSKNLRDGLDYSLSLERLGRVFIQFDQPPLAFRQLADERQALYQQDIPFFITPVDGTELVLEDGSRLVDYFPRSSLDRAFENLRLLDEADLVFQSQLIEMSLRARLAEDAHASGRTAPAVPGPGTPEPVLPSTDGLPRELAAQAFVLADELQARALRGDENPQNSSAAWLGFSYIPEANRYLLSLSSANLYDGLSGTALFLAAASLARQDASLRALALAALRPVCQAMQAEHFDHAMENIGIGGASGLGGLVYALVRCAAWLDEPALLDEATLAVACLERKHIQDDQRLDVISGAAGCILGLLALHQARPDSDALERAIWCGQHLLRQQVPAGGGAAWKAWDGRLLTGFSHGAAGYACALLRLWRASGQAEFLEAARAAMAYEAGLFKPEAGGWPDLREDVSPQLDQPRYTIAWCHGASGIGLQRLEALPELDSPILRQELETALDVTRRVLLDSAERADHPCCGNLGRVELLYTAGLRLERPELVQEARQRAGALMQNAAQLGGWRFDNFLPRGLFTPGFFNGAAGVGYQLLRLSGEPSLPTVLTWE